MGQPPQPGQQQPPFWTSLVPLVLLFVILYFAMIRPQQRRQKQQAEMLKGVRPGDKVVTTGGVIGVVISVKEDSISVRSADSKFEVIKSAIAEIRERSGATKDS
jgi:preprotein translocase subunit YajC